LRRVFKGRRFKRRGCLVGERSRMKGLRQRRKGLRGGVEERC
jgi:hypothetical protein